MLVMEEEMAETMEEQKEEGDLLEEEIRATTTMTRTILMKMEME